MKKLIALLMVAGLAVSSISAIGCDSGSKTTTTVKKEVEKPNGEDATIKKEVTESKTGDAVVTPEEKK